MRWEKRRDKQAGRGSSSSWLAAAVVDATPNFFYSSIDRRSREEDGQGTSLGTC